MTQDIPAPDWLDQQFAAELNMNPADVLIGAAGEPISQGSHEGAGESHDAGSGEGSASDSAHAEILSPALFFERLQNAASDAAAGLALVIVDIDSFHAINTAHGYLAGDRFLRAFARRLAGRLRPGDMISRLGGDEFAIALFDVFDAASATTVTRQMLAGLDHPFAVDAEALQASARAGLVLCPEFSRDVRALLFAARAALRNAKETGVDIAATDRSGESSPLQLAAPAIGSGRDDVLTGRELRDGLLRGEFKVHYQPIHNFATGRVDTMEALVRWRHPHRGLLSPASFLPLAERTGLVHVINVRVLDCACANLRRWRTHGHEQMRVAVNLAAQDFRRDDFAGTVAAMLERHKLPASSLELELTEHEQLDDARAIAQVQELARSGIALTIDDFGTKYSSLQYLARLPVRALKVDGTFVHDVGQSKASTSIVAAVVGIAGKMGLRLVAEGVEDLRQMNELRRLGCHIMQGFLFSPPVPADDVPQYLARALPAA